MKNGFSCIQEHVNDALHFLYRNKYVDLIDPNVDASKETMLHQNERSASRFELLWSAVEGSFNLDELTDLHHLVTSTNKSQGQGKAHLLSTIKKVVTCQKDIFGISLKENFYKLMTKALKRRAKSLSMIVRLRPHIYTLLRRIQRLYQVLKRYTYIYNIYVLYIPCEKMKPMYGRYRTWEPRVAFRR